MTNLRRRLEEELRLRGYSPLTIKAYVRVVKNFAEFHGCSPDRMGAQEVRAYLLHLTDEKKLAPASINQALAGIRFFYINVLDRPCVVDHVVYQKRKKKLPVVLTEQEVTRLLDAAATLRDRAILMMLPPPSNPLFRARFLASRASLAEVAHSIQFTPIPDGQRVGLFVVRRATFDEGRLRLVTSYCGLVDECGIVYSPHPLPSRLAGDHFTRLGGPWYHLYSRFQNRWLRNWADRVGGGGAGALRGPRVHVPPPLRSLSCLISRMLVE